MYRVLSWSGLGVVVACSGASHSGAPASGAPSASASVSPPVAASDAGVLCGLYVADGQGLFESLRFLGGGRVTVNSMGLELTRRYARDGDALHVEGGLDAVRLADGSLKVNGEQHFVKRAGEPSTCEALPSDTEMTCFDRAEVVRRSGAVQKAQDAHQACCDSGNLQSCAAYGTLVFVRTGNAGDAAPPLAKACDVGMGDACATLAAIAAQRGDRRERRRYLELACKGQNADACVALTELDAEQATP
jgi:hypothetical protein